MRPKDTNGVKISENVTYVGSFSFETESMKAEEIVSCKKEMINIDVRDIVKPYFSVLAMVPFVNREWLYHH